MFVYKFQVFITIDKINSLPKVLDYTIEIDNPLNFINEIFFQFCTE